MVQPGVPRYLYAVLHETGQNLLNGRHSEFGRPNARHLIERSVFGKVTWRF
jgi:hypothetical protein